MSVHDPDLPARLLGTASDPRAAAAADEAAAVAAAVRRVPLPSAQLPGWQSRCATEYAAAVRELHREIGLAAGALALVVAAAQ